MRIGTNYGDDNTGIYIKAVPLGIFGRFEHWLCTSGVGNTNTLISFEIATGNITYTQLALYLGVVTVFNKTDHNIQVSGYGHPAQWGAYCTTAPNHSYGIKSTFVINFNALTGAYISTSSRLKADGGLETGDGISAHGAYPYYISQGCIFGNTPELLVSLSNASGDNRTYECNETPQTYWSSQVSDDELLRKADQTKQQRKQQIISRLTEIDTLSVRPLRAVAAGTASDFDKSKLAELDEEAASIRAELSEI